MIGEFREGWNPPANQVASNGLTLTEGVCGQRVDWLACV